MGATATFSHPSKPLKMPSLTENLRQHFSRMSGPSPSLEIELTLSCLLLPSWCKSLCPASQVNLTAINDVSIGCYRTAVRDLYTLSRWNTVQKQCCSFSLSLSLSFCILKITAKKGQIILSGN